MMALHCALLVIDPQHAPRLGAGTATIESLPEERLALSETLIPAADTPTSPAALRRILREDLQTVFAALDSRTRPDGVERHTLPAQLLNRRAIAQRWIARLDADTIQLMRIFYTEVFGGAEGLTDIEVAAGIQREHAGGLAGWHAELLADATPATDTPAAGCFTNDDRAAAHARSLEALRRSGIRLSPSLLALVVDAAVDALQQRVDAQEGSYVGQRVMLLGPCNRPHFTAPAGATGTIVELTAALLAVRLDDPPSGADEWHGEVHWYEADLQGRSMQQLAADELAPIRPWAAPPDRDVDLYVIAPNPWRPDSTWAAVGRLAAVGGILEAAGIEVL